jgi:hypothetical protein
MVHTAKKRSSTKRARSLRRVSKLPPADEGWAEALLNRQSYMTKPSPPVDQWWSKYISFKENLRVAVLCDKEVSAREKRWRSLIDPHYVDSAQLVHVADKHSAYGQHLQHTRQLAGTFDVLACEYCTIIVEKHYDNDIMYLLRKVLQLGGHLIINTIQYELLAKFYASNDAKKERQFRQALVPDTWWYLTHRGRGGHAMLTFQAYLYKKPL